MGSDELERKLLPNGPPTDTSRAEFFELYKLMVASSEALVNRRQAVNTFFLTMNGALLTAIGLFLHAGGRSHLKAAGVFLVALSGVISSYAWGSLLKSFGQLNTGKFAIINAMERWLAASIYDAEWEALGRGEMPKIYKSFTSREGILPQLAMAAYTISAGISLCVWTGLWRP